MVRLLTLMGCLFCLTTASLGLTVYCNGIICGDVNGDDSVDPLDAATLMGWYGQPASSEGGTNTSCLDGLFSPDGYLDSNDLLAWDWKLSDTDALSLCDLNVWKTFMSGAGGCVETSFPGSGGTGSGGSLLIAGKRNVSDNFSMEDGLFVYDHQAGYVGNPFVPISTRANGRVTCDSEGRVYQINTQVGLTRFNDATAVVTTGGLDVSDDPRYHDNATVYVGLQKYGTEYGGRPILDAATDAQGFVYVVPVVVVPSLGPSATYLAAAKFQLHPGQTPCYSVVRLYDDPPGMNDVQDPTRTGLHEIEVDQDGNVFVISACRDNVSDFLWAYPAGEGSAVKVALDNISGVSGGITDPIALCASKINKLLYLASGQNTPEAGSTTIYALSTDNLTLSLSKTVQITGMGHVTGITEDQTTGTIWVAGFRMQNIPEYPDTNAPPFYQPYLAQIPSNSNDNVSATLLNSSDLALPLSIVWIPPTVQGTVALQDFVGDNASIPVTITIQSNPVETHTVNLDNDSHYSFTTNLTGTFDVTVKASHWVKSVLSNVVVNDNGTVIDASLINGDCDGDDNITSDDLSIVVAAMDSFPSDTNWDGRADLDGDNETTSTDLSIVLAAMPPGEQSQQGELATVQFTSNSTQIYPGDNFTLTVEVLTDNVSVTGLDYFVQVDDNGTGLFTLTDRNLDNSSFPYPIFSNPTVLDSAYATLSPQNGKDLAAVVENTNVPAGPGTMLVATLTLQSDPFLSPGTYTFTPVGLTVVDPNNVDFTTVTGQSATVEVLEGQNMMQGNPQDGNAAVADQVWGWLTDILGDDVYTYDPNNPPANLSPDDAELAALLWDWLLELGGGM